MSCGFVNVTRDVMCIAPAVMLEAGDARADIHKER
jgi:hypothetical protein